LVGPSLTQIRAVFEAEKAIDVTHEFFLQIGTKAGETLAEIDALTRVKNALAFGLLQQHLVKHK
jgi:hypothetical protein